VSQLNVNNITKYTGGEVVVNDASEDVDFRVESDGNANMLTVNAGSNLVGIAADPDLGAGLHIKTGDSGASVASNADELVIEGSSVSGMSILSANDSNGRISFGDDGDNDIGFIRYNHADNSFNFTTNTAQAINIDSSGAVTKPLQPAFSAHVASNVDPGTDGNYNVPYASEVFDNNADYNNGTYTFTAPVTGRYLFATTVRGYDVATSFSLDHRITTSNGIYYGNIGRYYSDQYVSTVVSLANMDASDTAIVSINSSESSFYISGDTYSYFHGHLVC